MRSTTPPTSGKSCVRIQTFSGTRYPYGYRAALAATVAVRTTDLDIVTNQQLQLSFFFIFQIKSEADPTTLGRWVKKRVKVNADMGD